MSIDELRDIASQYGAFVLEKEDGIHLIRPGSFDLIWHDDQLYTLDGKPLNKYFAEVGVVIEPMLEAIGQLVNQITDQLADMINPITLFYNQIRTELRIQYSHGRWTALPDYRIERKRRRTAIAKKRKNGRG